MNISVPGGVRASLRVSAELRECLIDWLVELGEKYGDDAAEMLLTQALTDPAVSEHIHSRINSYRLSGEQSEAA